MARGEGGVPKTVEGKARSSRGESCSCGIHPADRCPGARQQRDITVTREKADFTKQIQN
jgi:hypothetical protein